LSVDDVHAVTKYEPWFLRHIAEIVAEEQAIEANGLPVDAAGLRRLKAMGLSDKRLAKLAVRSVALKGSANMARSGLLHD
ncbi:hypothetical protein ABTH53_20695, partial [Acinetobacter baumannii]